MLRRIREKLFKSDAKPLSRIHPREVWRMEDPATGVAVEFDEPVSIWRALGELDRAKAEE